MDREQFSLPGVRDVHLDPVFCHCPSGDYDSFGCQFFCQLLVTERLFAFQGNEGPDLFFDVFRGNVLLFCVFYCG